MTGHRHYTFETADGYRSPFLTPTPEAAAEAAAQVDPDGPVTVVEVEGPALPLHGGRSESADTTDV